VESLLHELAEGTRQVFENGEEGGGVFMIMESEESVNVALIAVKSRGSYHDHNHIISYHDHNHIIS
jgi:hypothetical protein